MNTPKYVAVFLHNKPFFGHQVTAIPFMFYVRKMYPDKKIILVAPEKSSFVLQALGYADELCEYSPSKQVMSLFKVLHQLRKKHIDVAYTHRRSSINTAIIARLSTQNGNVIGFDDPSIRFFLRQRKEFIKQRYVGVNYINLVDKSLPEFATAIEKKPSNAIVIIPGGQDGYKKYPLEKYISLGLELMNEHEIHFIIGDDMVEEIHMLDNYKSSFCLYTGEPIPIVEKTILQAALVIANDCGPSHFAHIHDIPRICLFAGKRNVDEWYHDTENAVLLQSDDVDDIGAIKEEQIMEKAHYLLSKTPPLRKL